jgi:hypothetical protein
MIREKPLHVGICKGIGDNDGFYVITAEYLDGYIVLASYKTLAAAKAQLPRLKRKLKDSLR